jgi:hypothetical protein
LSAETARRICQVLHNQVDELHLAAPALLPLPLIIDALAFAAHEHRDQRRKEIADVVSPIS